MPDVHAPAVECNEARCGKEILTHGTHMLGRCRLPPHWQRTLLSVAYAKHVTSISLSADSQACMLTAAFECPMPRRVGRKCLQPFKVNGWGWSKPNLVRRAFEFSLSLHVARASEICTLSWPSLSDSTVCFVMRCCVPGPASSSGSTVFLVGTQCR